MCIRDRRKGTRKSDIVSVLRQRGEIGGGCKGSALEAIEVGVRHGAGKLAGAVGAKIHKDYGVVGRNTSRWLLSVVQGCWLYKLVALLAFVSNPEVPQQHFARERVLRLGSVDCML